MSGGNIHHNGNIEIFREIVKKVGRNLVVQMVSLSSHQLGILRSQYARSKDPALVAHYALIMADLMQGGTKYRVYPSDGLSADARPYAEALFEDNTILSHNPAIAGWILHYMGGMKKIVEVVTRHRNSFLNDN